MQAFKPFVTNHKITSNHIIVCRANQFVKVYHVHSVGRTKKNDKFVNGNFTSKQVLADHQSPFRTEAASFSSNEEFFLVDTQEITRSLKLRQ